MASVFAFITPLTSAVVLAARPSEHRWESDGALLTVSRNVVLAIGRTARLDVLLLVARFAMVVTAAKVLAAAPTALRAEGGAFLEVAILNSAAVARLKLTVNIRGVAVLIGATGPSADRTRAPTLSVTAALKEFVVSNRPTKVALAGVSGPPKICGARLVPGT